MPHLAIKAVWLVFVHPPVTVFPDFLFNWSIHEAPPSDFAPLPLPSRETVFPENLVIAVVWLGSWQPCGQCSDKSGTFWAGVVACTLWHGGPGLHSCNIYKRRMLFLCHRFHNFYITPGTANIQYENRWLFTILLLMIIYYFTIYIHGLKSCYHSSHHSSQRRITQQWMCINDYTPTMLMSRLIRIHLVNLSYLSWWNLDIESKIKNNDNFMFHLLVPGWQCFICNYLIERASQVTAHKPFGGQNYRLLYRVKFK